MRTFIVGLALMAAPPATGKTIMVQGIGTDSCAEWTREHRRDGILAAAQNAWVTGYLSGYNAFGGGSGDVLKHRPLVDAEGALDTYCGSHPLDSIEIATAAVIGQLELR